MAELKDFFSCPKRNVKCVQLCGISSFEISLTPWNHVARLRCGNPLPEGVNLNETTRGKCYSAVVQSQQTVLQIPRAKAGHNVRNTHRFDVSVRATAVFYTAQVPRPDKKVPDFIKQKQHQCRFQLELQLHFLLQSSSPVRSRCYSCLTLKDWTEKINWRFSRQRLSRSNGSSKVFTNQK